MLSSYGNTDTGVLSTVDVCILQYEDREVMSFVRQLGKQVSDSAASHSPVNASLWYTSNVDSTNFLVRRLGTGTYGRST